MAGLSDLGMSGKLTVTISPMRKGCWATLVPRIAGLPVAPVPGAGRTVFVPGSWVAHPASNAHPRRIPHPPRGHTDCITFIFVGCPPAAGFPAATVHNL
jgi:hypothetical protein